MPFARPTLTDLRAQAAADITSSDLPGADGLLRKAVLRVLAWVQAGLAHLHYGYLDWISLQSVPYTATQEFLEGWAGLVGITREGATIASGTASFAGAAGTVVPAGTSILRGDGLAFATTAAATVAAGGTVAVPIAAVTAGSGGNSTAGTVLTLAGAVAGVNSTGAAATAVTGGADQETDDALRSRMLERYRSPPQGGSATDYVTWALAVTGVTRAWVSPLGAGPGTVVVYIMLDQAEAENGGFPLGTNGVSASDPRSTAATGDQLAVANALYPQQPVTALVTVCAPVPWPVNFTVANLLPSTAAIQAAISAALQDLFLREGSPLAATIYPSDWNAAIEAVAGITRFTVTSPSAPITPPLGSLPTLGVLTCTA